jgi:hypothetical protein
MDDGVDEMDPDVTGIRMVTFAEAAMDWLKDNFPVHVGNGEWRCKRWGSWHLDAKGRVLFLVNGNHSGVTHEPYLDIRLQSADKWLLHYDAKSWMDGRDFRDLWRTLYALKGLSSERWADLAQGTAFQWAKEV